MEERGTCRYITADYGYDVGCDASIDVIDEDERIFLNNEVSVNLYVRKNKDFF